MEPDSTIIHIIGRYFLYEELRGERREIHQILPAMAEETDICVAIDNANAAVYVLSMANMVLLPLSNFAMAA